METGPKLWVEAATGSVLSKKVFLKISQNSQENTCARVSFLIKLQASACNFITKETLAQVFSCEFCEFSKSTYFEEHLLTAASVLDFWIFRTCQMNMIIVIIRNSMLIYSMNSFSREKVQISVHS